MTVNSGSIRFNTDSAKMEIYNGEQWWEIDSTSPELHTGGTRGVIAVGADNTSYNDTIQFINIDSTGDATDFGDTTGTARGYGSSFSSRTRGIFAGGQNSGVNQNVLDFVTIASTGNAQDFGDITDVLVRYPSGLGNQTRGMIVGGYISPADANTNVMEFITIASTGNAADFGDLLSAARQLSGISDSHGGLGE